MTKQRTDDGDDGEGMVPEGTIEQVGEVETTVAHMPSEEYLDEDCYRPGGVDPEEFPCVWCGETLVLELIDGEPVFLHSPDNHPHDWADREPNPDPRTYN